MGALKHFDWAMISDAVDLTFDQQKTILARVVGGETMFDICKSLNIPREYVGFYAAKDPLFAKCLRQNREIVVHDLVDRLPHIADDAVDAIDLGKARIFSENVKWLAAKIIPMVYGDHISVQHTHKLDLSGLLDAADIRIQKHIETKAETIEDAKLVAGAGDISELL